MKIGWGWKIGGLYGVFVVLIVGLVVASSRQKIDLVSKDYYKDEIAYQGVLDASKNQANLAGELSVHANASEVIIDFPAEFSKADLKGDVNFYSAANQDWDKNFTITTSNNKLVIPRTGLMPTKYTVKVRYSANGQNFYYEAELNLHTS
ncbi:hypothetical protein CJD36_008435 [Flavipsychrobacter stenotrophus]|uniref:Nitrogen fixation protein FixH n=1 Tax=Flavipsychrobacter stenotrophus TaxID=2077091 RepID=A0A2S7SY20_9BACT|nr:FixH family protein [Flavipsychrobacter stenotrophus]PQJ11812.1 hypothetical protein CJD36_008435 [Flavipsychrobacter stenotrophus]